MTKKFEGKTAVGLVPINAQVSTNRRALPDGRQTGSYHRTRFTWRFYARCMSAKLQISARQSCHC